MAQTNVLGLGHLGVRGIDNYVQEVRQVLPHYDLSDRRFGGLSRASATRAPILGAGFGHSKARCTQMSFIILGIHWIIRLSGHDLMVLSTPKTPKNLPESTFRAAGGTTATRSLTVFARQFGLKARYFGHFCLASTWDSSTSISMTDAC